MTTFRVRYKLYGGTLERVETVEAKDIVAAHRTIPRMHVIVSTSILCRAICANGEPCRRFSAAPLCPSHRRRT